MNHHYLPDLFHDAAGGTGDAVVLHLGRVLKAAWPWKHKGNFPGRDIAVSSVEDGIEDLLGCELTLFQERAEHGPG
jgi:hypothetical protein